MRLHTNKDDVASYIGALARSISIDPGSLEDWLCLHISIADPTPEVTLGLTSTLWKNHAQANCDVFCCEEQGDIFIVSRQISASRLFQMADDAAAHSGNPAIAMRGYELLHDWRDIRNLLLEKVSPTSVPFLHQEYGHDLHFGDMKSLTGIFKESAHARESRSPLHIMVVEDDPMTQRIVCNTLKDNYAVIPVSTAYDAVANYLLFAPDIVFLDIGLPDTNGFKVLQQITESDPEAYVVMFSGDGDLDNIVSALNSGACGFITKPFNRDKLRQYIANGASWRNKHVEA